MAALEQSDVVVRGDVGQTGRRDISFLAAVVGVSIAVAVVNVLTTSDDLRQAGRPIPMWEPVVWEITSLVALIAMTPAIMALTRAVRPMEAPWSRVALHHVPASLAFSVAHVAVMGMLRWVAYAAVGEDYQPFEPLRSFPYELRKDLLTYATLVAVYTGWLKLSSFAVPAPSSDQASIEIRDGPRRRFVPLAEVAWIEAAGNYVELHRGLTPILHRASLSTLERELGGAGFVRIHRSRLVRRDAVAEVESKPSGDYVVRLADGRELAGSRRYRRPLLQQ